MFLLRLGFGFAKRSITRPTLMKSQPRQASVLLRDYFRDRMVYTASNYVSFAQQISKHRFSLKDPIWQNYLLSVERNLADFDQNAKTIIRTQSQKPSQLTLQAQILVEDLHKRVYELNANDAVFSLWAAIKNDMASETIVTASYRALLTSVNKANEESINLDSEPGFCVDEERDGLLPISRWALVMLPWCINEVGIVDKTLLKLAIKALSDYTEQISLRQAALALAALLDLDQTSKRIAAKLSFRILELSEQLRTLDCVATASLIQCLQTYKIRAPDAPIFVNNTTVNGLALQAVNHLMNCQDKQARSGKFLTNALYALKKLSCYSQQEWTMLLKLIVDQVQTLNSQDLVKATVSVCDLGPASRANHTEAETQLLNRVWLVFHQFSGRSLRMFVEVARLRGIKVPAQSRKDFYDAVRELQLENLKQRDNRKQASEDIGDKREKSSKGKRGRLGSSEVDDKSAIRIE